MEIETTMRFPMERKQKPVSTPIVTRPTRPVTRQVRRKALGVFLSYVNIIGYVPKNNLPNDWSLFGRYHRILGRWVVFWRLRGPF